jgi:creatinine amidohydrolase
MEVAGALPANPRSLVTAIASGCQTFEEAGGPRAYFGDPSRASAEEGRASPAELGQKLGQILWEAIQDAFAG